LSWLKRKWHEQLVAWGQRRLRAMRIDTTSVVLGVQPKQLIAACETFDEALDQLDEGARFDPTLAALLCDVLSEHFHTGAPGPLLDVIVSTVVNLRAPALRLYREDT
jgi:F420-0:gamma-glutamyl ligase-like protein